MNGEWCYFKQYFTPEECNEIINTALTLEPQQAVLGVNGTELDVNLEYRRSQVRFISKDDWRFKSLFEKMWQTAWEANRDFFNFHITKLDYIQFAEYDESYQGEYKTHHDVFWLNNDPFYHRKLSCVVQLTDPGTYTGCDLEITEASQQPDIIDLRSQGTLVYFPSFLRHRATPIIRGKRYSLAAWFDGPKWC